MLQPDPAFPYLQIIDDTALPSGAEHLLSAWADRADSVLDDALYFQRIPAPTFAESERAIALERRFRQLSLHDVHTDDLGNVYARTKSRKRQPALMVSAHLDTVFPADTELMTPDHNEPDRVYGPGLGDNSLGVAGMLNLAAAFHEYGITPPCDIWWVATVGEEGNGDLRGMRRACDTLASRLGMAIVIEGMGIGRIYHAGLGVRRLQVTVNGPGGHSWLHSDRPSAIHHLVQLGAALTHRLNTPAHPRTSFNIGLIDGGTSINTRAAQASFSIDLRSESTAALARTEDQLRAILDAVPQITGLTTTVDVIGDRPSAAVSSEHPLVQAARAVLIHLGYMNPSLEIGSTDANIPLSRQIPTICIGLTGGGNAHTVDEYIEIQPIAQGMRQLTLLTLLAAANMPDWKTWKE